VLTAMPDKHRTYLDGGGVFFCAPAKVNLSLAVFNRRNDGFHDLHSIMSTINLFDDLRIELSDKPGIKLHCSGLDSPSGHDNLVYQAAELLAEQAGLAPSLDIYLHKRIPAGAGLGGASSDAASCLHGLNLLWQLGLSRDELVSAGARLGSDIPFFFYGPVAKCTGLGEIVTELPNRCRKSLLLILPEIHVSTAKVYENYVFDEIYCADCISKVHAFLSGDDLAGLAGAGLNILTHVTMELFEPLGVLRDRLESMGIGPVNMSGSGSCLFVASKSNQQLLNWRQLIRGKNIANAQIVDFQEHSHLSMEVQHANIRS